MEASKKSPDVRLNNGVMMPLLGFGVYRIAPNETADVVAAALQAGYRLIDTAAAYNNEKGVSEGILRSGVDRSEIFVTTKLWPTDYGYEAALKAFDKSLLKLGLEQVDMFLLHWPLPDDFSQTVGAYKALEKRLADGKARAIGVCNHNADNLKRLADETGIVPAVNQIELHPFFIQNELIRTHQRMGTVTQAWSPLGGVNIYDAATPDKARKVLNDPVILGLAEKYGKTPAQIVLRWHVQHGVSAIPKSTRRERILENISIFDFELAEDEVTAIDGLDTGLRGGDDPPIVTKETYAVTTEP